MRKIKRIILHCAATAEGKEITPELIRVWHTARGFNDIGYHYIIGINGELWEGRSEEVIGAHCKGYNSDSIGVCYIGGLDKNMKPKDTRNDKQKNVMYTLIASLLNKYPEATVHCHNEFSEKHCPSFTMEDF